MMPYRRVFVLRLEDVDANYVLTNKAILELMENTSDEDSAKVGDDIRSLNAQGLSWVIVEWDLKVFLRPKYHEKVTVYTWPREVNSRYVWRDFEIFWHGQKVAAASSKWMIIKLDSKTIVRFDGERLAKYQIDPRVALPEQPRGRISVLDEYDTSRPIHIRHADIDLNGHMHNSTYLDLIKEINPQDARAIRIIFHREIKLGDKVTIKSRINHLQQSIAIVNAENEAYALVEQTV